MIYVIRAIAYYLILALVCWHSVLLAHRYPNSEWSKVFMHWFVHDYRFGKED